MKWLVILEICRPELLLVLILKIHFSGKQERICCYNCHYDKLHSIWVSNSNTSILFGNYNESLFIFFIVIFISSVLSLSFYCVSVKPIILLESRCLSKRVSAKRFLKDCVLRRVTVNEPSLIFVVGRGLVCWQSVRYSLSGKVSFYCSPISIPNKKHIFDMSYLA